MASIAGAMIGAQQASADRNAAMNAQQQALRQYLGIQIPDVQNQQLSLAHPEYLGNFQAQGESANQMAPTAYGNIQLDPRLQQAQMGALQQLSALGQTGLTPGEKAALDQARRGAAQEAQAKSSQLMSEFARRGMGGSGAELAARLQAGQSGADQQAQASDRLMQDAQQRALQAMTQSASLAGQVRGQQYGEQSDLAKARDYINQFNTQNQQNVQQRNVASANAANMRNLQEQQRIGESGTNISNQQQQYNKALIQQQFNNQMARAAGATGQYNGISNALRGQAANTAGMYGTIGQGIDTGIGNYMTNGGYFNSKKPTNASNSNSEQDTKDALDLYSEM